MQSKIYFKKERSIMDSSKKGLYIAFEGIDGSGKGTQINKFMKRINRLIPTAPVLTTEPSDGPIGKLIRSKYLTSKRISDPQTLRLLYAADRLDNITNTDNGIKNILDSGTSVVSDRCFLSSCAYDTYRILMDDQNKSIPEKTNSDFDSEVLRVLSVNSQSLKLCIPDIIFFIDVPADIAMKRIETRGKAKELYEDLYKLSAISKAYKWAISIIRDNDYKTNIYIIDGNDTEENIADTIMNYTEYKLRERHLI